MHDTTLREVEKVKTKYKSMTLDERRDLIRATLNNRSPQASSRSLSGIGRACGDDVTVFNDAGRRVDLWIVEERLMSNPGDAESAVAFAINIEGDVLAIESRRL